MNDPRLLDYEKRRYTAIKERLLADDPEIDERTLADTVEGLTDIHGLLAAFVRGAIEDEIWTEALDIRIAQMTDRRKRFQNRAAQRRQKVRDAMVETDIQKIVKEDFSAALHRQSPHVVIVDENLIPDLYCEYRRHVRKADILPVLKQGETVEGAVLSNPTLSLNVRTR